MAVPFSNTKLRVPKGFQNLLEGLAREVLRSQPKEVYSFGAQYFESLLKQREESGVDPAEHGAKMEDRFYNNTAFSQPEIDPSNPQQQDAALAIQTKFRQHEAKLKVEEIREVKAATKIQAGFRGYQDRVKVKQMRNGGPIDGVAPEEEEIDIDLNDPEVEAAAVKIQAGFKGFKTRKGLQQTEGSSVVETSNDCTTSNKEPGDTDGETVDIDLNDPDVEKAAVMIQAGFRGMKTRTELNDTKKGEHKESEVNEGSADRQTDSANQISAPDKNSEAHGMPERETQDNQIGQDTQTTSEEAEAVDIDLNDPDVEKAAVKIQAGFRGMKTRSELKDKPLPSESAAPAAEAAKELQPEVLEAVGVQQVQEVHQQETLDKCAAPEADVVSMKGTVEEDIDIDLTDPDVEAAAIKIQSSFKGFKTRKDMASNKEGENQDTEPKSEAPGNTVQEETTPAQTDSQPAATEEVKPQDNIETGAVVDNIGEPVPELTDQNPTIASENAANDGSTAPDTTTEQEVSAETAVEPQAETAAEPQTETAAEPQAETAAEPQTETAAEPQAETAAEPQTETAAEPQAETAAEPQTETAAEPQAETAAEPQTETAAEPQAETAAEPQSETAAEPQAETAAEPQAETAAEPQTETATEPQAETTPESQADATAEPKAEQETQQTTEQEEASPQKAEENQREPPAESS